MHARAARPLKKLVTPVERFLQTESSGGVILIACAFVAFLWANSPWAEMYFGLQHIEIGISAGGWGFSTDLHHWINDGLMAIFFFVVGLEIKRECLCGQLASWQGAGRPAVGGLGGMVAPACIFLAFNGGLPSADGWGVPMATDIAFAIGVLALVGTRVPLSLKVFLLALAIVDDLGAVLVIALFYTSEVNLPALAAALAVIGIAGVYGRSGGGSPTAFLVFGLASWAAMFASGVHATIAGVLLAMTVPMVHRIGAEDLDRELEHAIGETDFESFESRLDHIENLVDKAQSPLHELERTLQPYVSYAIMPLFALVNAGVAIGGGGGDAMIGIASIGVFFGLLVGKPLGIAGAVAIAVLCRVTRLPDGTSWAAIVGVGFLGGVGFTMAIFIGNLAFEGPELDQVKLGILGASLIAAAAGYTMLRMVLPEPGAERDVTAGAMQPAHGGAGAGRADRG